MSGASVELRETSLLSLCLYSTKMMAARTCRQEGERSGGGSGSRSSPALELASCDVRVGLGWLEGHTQALGQLIQRVREKEVKMTGG